MMKSSISKLCPEFNMHRMAIQYAGEAYVTAHRRFRNLSAADAARAKQVAAWLGKVRGEWPRISVESVADGASEIRLGEEVLVSARVTLNSLSPEDVAVQVLAGPVDAEGNLTDPVMVPMRLAERDSAGACLFQAVVQSSTRSGLHGYAIRLIPSHPDSISPYLPGLIKWARASSPVAELQAR